MWMILARITHETTLGTRRLAVKDVYVHFNEGKKIETVWDLIWPFGDKFQNRPDQKGLCMKVFQDWMDQVKTRVPKEKLIVFDVKEGWEPLHTAPESS
mmetsp:Transcript_30082/g.47148  ORF Transcript_30082/g.47148 Transcript_30082/m.47148 type:complete len:98 (-) Transcript_30082:5-298(-)